MKICAIICEYNPFHNGHLYHLREAKRLSGADAILCIMSGNFVQRGEAAILNKYIRAKHAIQAGADAVIELPSVFATSNAELFAKGAIHILSSIPAVDTLCFGAETADAAAFLNAANLLNNEPEQVSARIKALTNDGLSYAKARAIAWDGVLPNDLLSSPNNILGLEYTKAILSTNANIRILPISRIGNHYNSKQLNEQTASATAIRNGINENISVSKYVPDFVECDLPCDLQCNLELLEKYAILSRNTNEIKRVCDCTEGLENAFKKAALLDAPLSETLTSARYTTSRIRRIALQNLLNIDEQLIREALTAPLYLKVLAINATRKDLLTALSAGISPIIIRTQDKHQLCPTAIKCMQKDEISDQIYNLIYAQTQKEKNIFISL